MDGALQVLSVTPPRRVAVLATRLMSNSPSGRARRAVRATTPNMLELLGTVERLVAHREDDQRAAAAQGADIRQVLTVIQEMRGIMATSSQVRDVDDRLRELQSRVERFEPELQSLTNNSAKRSEVQALESDLASALKELKELRVEVKDTEKRLSSECEARFKPLEDARSRASAIIWLMSFFGASGIVSALAAFVWWVANNKP